MRNFTNHMCCEWRKKKGRSMIIIHVEICKWMHPRLNFWKQITMAGMWRHRETGVVVHWWGVRYTEFISSILTKRLTQCEITSNLRYVFVSIFYEIIVRNQFSVAARNEMHWAMCGFNVEIQIAWVFESFFLVHCAVMRQRVHRFLNGNFSVNTCVGVCLCKSCLINTMLLSTFRRFCAS